ncbi:1-deoxy-D-xylulose-5-phosphate reductoisomerase [Stomatohabitans albus]|uniref:1-deoxy-D-xylulose-5-phosphate reductoisomerase n=1 Tax=Stomatohabitans albus TaxID=3110766 RepID=UPI00300CE65B
MRRISLLGSTGSIGVQTIDVVESLPDDLMIVGLANRGNPGIIDQALRCGATYVGIVDPDVAAQARSVLEPEGITVIDGPDAATAIASIASDVVVNGMDGLQGIGPSIAALQSGAALALANKESMVAGAALLHTAAGGDHDRIIPVDSEHSALAQCLRSGEHHEVGRLVLTASGGPFRGRTRDELANVTINEVLAHPTWDMGALVTVNSASLANKGLEVIEAHALFGVDYDAIDVVVHPQSIVHSMVEFVDGSTIAQLAPPDMRSAIQLALTWPERKPVAPVAMDWSSPQTLTFEAPDRLTFPLLDIFIQAGRTGGSAPIVATAANEIAVEALLANRISFLQIPTIVTETLDWQPHEQIRDVADVYAIDSAARAYARTKVEQLV